MHSGFGWQVDRLSYAEFIRRNIRYNKPIKTGYAHLIQPTTFKGIKIMSVTIKTELTSSEFYELYKENSYVKGFSFKGAEAVLAFISDTNADSNQIVDWTGYFMAAGEYSSAELVDNFAHVLEDHTEALIDAASRIAFNDEIDAKIENEEGEYYSDELWSMLKDDLLKDADFVQEAAEIISQNIDEAIVDIDDGRWVTMG